MKKTLVILLVVTMLVVPACASPAVIESTQPPASDRVETSAPALPADAQPGCQTAAEGSQVVKNDEMDICFEYPEEYSKILIGPAEICLVPGQPSKPGEPDLKCHEANFFANVEPANGRTASQVAEMLMAEAAYPEKVVRTDLTVGGEAAIQLDGLTGVDIHRKVVLISGDRLYTLMFTPWDDTSESSAGIRDLYTTIIGSFVLLP